MIYSPGELHKTSGQVRGMVFPDPNPPRTPFFMSTPIALETPGKFSLGCNYWASHAGTAMWSDWRPEVVDGDFAKLAAHGLTYLRVFPLWPDFQPITQLRGGSGRPVEIRFGEEPLPDDAVGQAGVSAVMLERFSEFCGLAEKHGLKLIVGLVTGWMSGRLFVPPALNGLDPITDATSLAWQAKFVRTLVRHARNETAIAAWDLGNECNCMGNATTRDEAYVWTANISHAIRATDPTRPIVSGMHSLTASVGGIGNTWFIEDQAELTDILTTHPYPYWSRHTRADAVTSFRTTIHATAETRFYTDIGGKPCFAEEIGSMGPMVAGDDASADFARVNLFSLWANDCRAFLWWCAHDQTELTHAPYDWVGVELELGLLRNDGSAKPVLQEMAAFSEFLAGLPFKELPRRKTEAVCVLTHDQDDWAVAYGTMTLAKQAKLEIEFRHIQQALPESDVYLLPSIKGPMCVPLRRWRELLRRVEAGATLYVSLGDGIVPDFNRVAGVELVCRGAQPEKRTAVFANDPELLLPLIGGDDLVFRPAGAEVLATRTNDGTPAFWKHRYGSGQVIVFAAPIESQLAMTPGAFDEGSPAYWQIYREVVRTAGLERWVVVDSTAVAVTEHAINASEMIVIVINHSGVEQLFTADITAGATLAETFRGSVSEETAGVRIALAAKQAAVFRLVKN